MTRILMGLLAILIISLISFGGAHKWASSNKDSSNISKWVGTWTASMQAPAKEGNSHEGFEDQTIRLIIRPHIDGDEMRIRLSNEFGSLPLSLKEVRVAVSKEDASVDGKTDQVITFDGKESVTIPAGEKQYSDSIKFTVDADQNLTVSLYVDKETGPTTWHQRSTQTVYMSKKGNHAADAEGSSYTSKEEAWFWLDRMEVVPDDSVDGAVVVIGSSIANGNNSTMSANHRWPDYLANRMHEKDSKVKLSVLNAGVSANHLINSETGKGENALARLKRDALSQKGVKAVILHEGINDIRHYPEYDSEQIIDRMKQIIKATHKEGLTIYGGTLTPFKESGMYTEEGEKTRQEVNEWIRTSGAFDAVIDFDKALRDPDDPEKFLSKYDSGDHLHPNDDGYKKMAETVDLSVFE
ncbi:SGNH/GDSL hydrolase family protein [Bacillus sp. NTK071]|uniref:SGNH/GDSL hydrolase family protein n=1 Tax=Bacillus sp. NTK071 TaxID=2802175 RepID=UPI001A8F0302|nr:SGNH/GDSL hydrolase family protein [Bacillus sp. NTK071]MBN8208982.1 SGNH/GDSL hydrolase family protein [Bacillus sp. NTK071]